MGNQDDILKKLQKFLDAMQDLAWSKFSLKSALGDNADEDFGYTLNDLKIKFQ